MKATFVTAALAAMLGIVASTAFGAVTLVNGDFEATPFTANTYTKIAVGAEPSGFGWTVGGVSIDGLNKFRHDPGYNNTPQYVDLNGTPGPGSISQQFQSVAGQAYNLSFAFSHNADVTSSTARWSILQGVTTLITGDFTHTNASVGQGSLNWLFSVNSFTGNGGLLTVLFEQILPSGKNAGVFLDSVTITETPEPSTLVSFGLLALVGGGLIAYKRRKSLVVG